MGRAVAGGRTVKPVPIARASDAAAAVWLPVDALRPNPRNPRAHGAEVQRLARTIVRTTWGAPIDRKSVV